MAEAKKNTGKNAGRKNTEAGGAAPIRDLPEMPAGPMMGVVPAHVGRHPAVHECAEKLRRFSVQQKMEVVRHQAEADGTHRVASFGGCEAPKKWVIVTVLGENGGAVVAAVEDVEDLGLELGTGTARHGDGRDVLWL